jgi:Fur family ferric uptake transcriptional regulator
VKSNFTATDDVLSRHGLRRTPVRVGVIELLSRSGRPLSVPQILAKLRGVDTVTVYRTLNTFARKKMVHKVRGDDRTWLYAAGDCAARAQHLHPHFVCDECGKVECLEGSRIPGSFVEALAVDRTYTVLYPEVVLHGMCPRCR